MKYLKIFVYYLAILVFSTVYVLFTKFIDSFDWLNSFLNNNVLNIEIALFAITIPSIAVILTRIAELNINLPKTLQSIKNSIKEQIIIIIITFFMIATFNSHYIQNNSLCFFITNILLVMSLACFLWITYDISKACFIILSVNQKI